MRLPLPLRERKGDLLQFHLLLDFICGLGRRLKLRLQTFQFLIGFELFFHKVDFFLAVLRPPVLPFRLVFFIVKPYKIIPHRFIKMNSSLRSLSHSQGKNNSNSSARSHQALNQITTYAELASDPKSYVISLKKNKFESSQ